jgi:hypothetical protein
LVPVALLASPNPQGLIELSVSALRPEETLSYFALAVLEQVPGKPLTQMMSALLGCYLLGGVLAEASFAL